MRPNRKIKSNIYDRNAYILIKCWQMVEKPKNIDDEK